ncbi:hypothetical protein CXG81DRAFT_25721 [Caulochytrium protostelioides]|uniref:Uncharacterized protein n=1 Tax=Caulochytrium protostelioides TaxID=1555241 RepID=A0A4P9X8N5_9FUNG|nr:hypothetical protein CXG81DRAFT_25721 [Caulochytrium protostelioides]|eukprot:RKP01625.1 hypothetical protein CXG81DRAFT_25721 [Caulochytrium protostelioides]
MAAARPRVALPSAHRFSATASPASLSSPPSPSPAPAASPSPWTMSRVGPLLGQFVLWTSLPLLSLHVLSQRLQMAESQDRMDAEREGLRAEIAALGGNPDLARLDSVIGTVGTVGTV